MVLNRIHSVVVVVVVVVVLVWLKADQNAAFPFAEPSYVSDIYVLLTVSFDAIL